MPLSSKQMEYLALAWACFESEPKIDYEKFRELAGLKTAHSARELMRVTKNKLKSEYGPLSDGVQARNLKTATSTPTKPVTPGKKSSSEQKSTGRKRTAASAVADTQLDADDAFFQLAEADASPSPFKKARTVATQPERQPVVKEEQVFAVDLSGANGYF